MPDSSAASPAPPSSPPPPPPTPTHIPTHADLFLAFFKIAISGFGGALPWTRRMFVEEKRWMTPQEFNDSYALCQFLPGPNIVNLAAVFGARMRGASGALACWLGFLGPPFVLMTTVGLLYARYGDAEILRKILGGIAAAAAGIMISTFVRMAEPLFRLRPSDSGEGVRRASAPLVMLAIVGAIAIMRWPLLWVMAAAVPLAILLAWVRR
jgi:chromate transporter